MLMIGFILGTTLGLLIGLFIFNKCEASETEQDKVTKYIHKNGSITANQAKSIGINHVRSVVCKMKREGKAIHNVNPLGQKAKYEFK